MFLLPHPPQQHSIFGRESGDSAQNRHTTSALHHCETFSTNPPKALLSVVGIVAFRAILLQNTRQPGIYNGHVVFGIIIFEQINWTQLLEAIMEQGGMTSRYHQTSIANIESRIFALMQVRDCRFKNTRHLFRERPKSIIVNRRQDTRTELREHVSSLVRPSEPVPLHGARLAQSGSDHRGRGRCHRAPAYGHLRLEHHRDGAALHGSRKPDATRRQFDALNRGTGTNENRIQSHRGCRWDFFRKNLSRISASLWLRLPKEGQHKQAFSMSYRVPLSPHVPLNSSDYY
jgi:hypothetical protein